MKVTLIIFLPLSTGRGGGREGETETKANRERESNVSNDRIQPIRIMTDSG